MTILQTVAECISAVAAVLAVFFAWKTLRQMGKDQSDGLNREKQQATLDAFNVMQDQVFDEINKYSVSQIKEIAEDSSSPEFKILGGYLARIEHFCVGLNRGIYDMETFYDLCHGYFDSEKGILMPRILPIIQKKKVSKDEDYFENLHKVWKMMKEIEAERKTSR